MNPNFEPISQHCLNSAQTDCIKLINEIFELPDVPMHGPIHHFIVPAVLFTCYVNSTSGDKQQLQNYLQTVAMRAEIIPGGSCALNGLCGASVGVGQFCSILTNNTPFSTTSWSNVMQVTSKCNLSIAKNGGPRCCKRDTYLALFYGVKYIKQHLGIVLKASLPVCNYHTKNTQCKKSSCIYYNHTV